MGKKIKETTVSKNRMKAPMNTRRTVILDGSNIVHGGRGARSQDPDGNRLISAISVYESKGYDVIPCMKGGTFHVMSGEALNRETEEKIPKAPGFDSLEHLSKSGFLRLFKSDDDLHIIHLALHKNAWIVTNDTFEDFRHPESGELIPRERTTHSELDWDLIDEMTWGTHRGLKRVYSDDTWKTEGPKFIHPTLSHAPTSLFDDEYAEIRAAVSQLTHTLQEIVRLSEKEDSRITDVNAMAKNWIHRVKIMASMIPVQKTPDKESLSQMTVHELKKICLELDLKRSGKKAELVDRISETLESEETSYESQDPVILVPLNNKGEAGAIIGTGGKRVQAIQADTGARLTVDDIGMTVQVEGSKEAVDHAKKEIEQILEELRNNSGANTVSISLLETREIKKIIGFKGKQIQAMQADTGARLIVDEDNMVVIIEGSQEQTEAARSQVEDILKQYRSQPTYPKENLPLKRSERTALLAEAGKAIRHLKQSSGARVYIQDIPENDEEWTLTISGTPESIQKAKELLEETINLAKDAHDKREAAKKAKREAEKAKKKAKREAEKAKKKAIREAERAKKKAAHQKMLAEHKAAKKAKREAEKAKKKAIREAEKGMTEQERRQAQSKRDKARAAAKKDAATE